MSKIVFINTSDVSISDFVSKIGIGMEGDLRHILKSSRHLPTPTENQKLDDTKLVQLHCLSRHSAEDAIPQAWGEKDFKRLSPDFIRRPFAYALAVTDVKWRQDRIAQIIKSGCQRLTCRDTNIWRTIKL